MKKSYSGRGKIDCMKILSAYPWAVMVKEWSSVVTV